MKINLREPVLYMICEMINREPDTGLRRKLLLRHS